MPSLFFITFLFYGTYMHLIIPAREYAIAPRSHVLGKFQAMRLSSSIAESKVSTNVIRNSNSSLKLLALVFSASFLGYILAYTWWLRCLPLKLFFLRKKRKLLIVTAKTP